MSDAPHPEGPLRRLLAGRMPVAAALAGITLVSWAYLFVLAGHMAMTMSAMGMQFTPWSPIDFALMFAMWWIMMIGMMTPGAAPLILIFDRISTGRRGRGQPFVSTAVFVAGYLAAWRLFSLLATLAQWGLESTALMLPMPWR